MQSFGPAPEPGQDPEFVLVAFQGQLKGPLDHFGFQCEGREAVTAIAERARDNGNLVEGPIDSGGSIGYFVRVRDPSGQAASACCIERAF